MTGRWAVLSLLWMTSSQTNGETQGMKGSGASTQHVRAAGGRKRKRKRGMLMNTDLFTHSLYRTMINSGLQQMITSAEI